MKIVAPNLMISTKYSTEIATQKFGKLSESLRKEKKSPLACLLACLPACLLACLPAPLITYAEEIEKSASMEFHKWRQNTVNIENSNFLEVNFGF